MENKTETEKLAVAWDEGAEAAQLWIFQCLNAKLLQKGDISWKPKNPYRENSKKDQEEIA